MKRTDDLMPVDGTRSTASNIKSHLINYLQIHEFTIIEVSESKWKGCLTVVSKNGRKEVIEVWHPHKHLSAKNKAVCINKNSKPQSVTSFSYFWFGSFLNFGRHFLGERTMVAVGIPDTKDYRLMIEKLQCYFTDNNISRKVYLIDGYGNVTITNLNQFEI